MNAVLPIVVMQFCPELGVWKTKRPALSLPIGWSAFRNVRSVEFEIGAKTYEPARHGLTSLGEVVAIG